MHWNCAKSAKTRNYNFTLSIEGNCIDHLQEKADFFQHDVYSYPQYIYEVSSEIWVGVWHWVWFLQGSTFSFARLDAIIATTVPCLHSVRTDKFECHRQKLYNNTFLSFLPNAFNPVTGRMRMFTYSLRPYRAFVVFIKPEHWLSGLIQSV